MEGRNFFSAAPPTEHLRFMLERQCRAILAHDPGTPDGPRSRGAASDARSDQACPSASAGGPAACRPRFVGGDSAGTRLAGRCTRSGARPRRADRPARAASERVRSGRSAQCGRLIAPAYAPIETRARETLLLAFEKRALHTSSRCDRGEAQMPHRCPRLSSRCAKSPADEFRKLRKAVRALGNNRPMPRCTRRGSEVSGSLRRRVSRAGGRKARIEFRAKGKSRFRTSWASTKTLLLRRRRFELSSPGRGGTRTGFARGAADRVTACPSSRGARSVSLRLEQAQQQRASGPGGKKRPSHIAAELPRGLIR